MVSSITIGVEHPLPGKGVFHLMVWSLISLGYSPSVMLPESSAPRQLGQSAWLTDGNWPSRIRQIRLLNRCMAMAVMTVVNGKLLFTGRTAPRHCLGANHEYELSNRAEDRTFQNAGAVSKGVRLNAHRTKDAEIHIRHAGFTLSPVLTMFQAHVGPPSDQGGQVF